MKKRNLAVIIGLVILVLSGCAFYPKWYRSPSKDQNKVYLYGFATKKNPVASFTSAEAMAYKGGAQYIENYLNSVTKDWLKESGTDDPSVLQDTERIIKMISKQKFSGGVITEEKHKLKDGKDWCFVRLELPSNEIKKQLVNHIRSEESLYNEMKAIKAYKELEKETENY